MPADAGFLEDLFEEGVDPFAIGDEFLDFFLHLEDSGAFEHPFSLESLGVGDGEGSGSDVFTDDSAVFATAEFEAGVSVSES